MTPVSVQVEINKISQVSPCHNTQPNLHWVRYKCMSQFCTVSAYFSYYQFCRLLRLACKGIWFKDKMYHGNTCSRIEAHIWLKSEGGEIAHYPLWPKKTLIYCSNDNRSSRRTVVVAVETCSGVGWAACNWAGRWGWESEVVNNPGRKGMGSGSSAQPGKWCVTWAGGVAAGQELHTTRWSNVREETEEGWRLWWPCSDIIVHCDHKIGWISLFNSSYLNMKLLLLLDENQ